MIRFLDLKKVNERFRAEMDAAAKRVLDVNPWIRIYADDEVV